MPTLYDDTYHGPRWRYGLPLRPPALYNLSSAGGQITLFRFLSED